MSALEALCDYALYKSTFTLHLHYITFDTVRRATLIDKMVQLQIRSDGSLIKVDKRQPYKHIKR